MTGQRGPRPEDDGSPFAGIMIVVGLWLVLASVVVCVLAVWR